MMWTTCFAANARVHETGHVDDRDPAPRCEPRVRLDEPCAAVGDRDRGAGPDRRAITGCDLGALARREIEAGIAVVGACRDDAVVAQAANRELDGHPLPVVACGRARFAGSASATRYGAKRRISLRGSRATISTPALPSSPP